MRKEALQQLKHLLPEGVFQDSPEVLVGYSYDSQAVESLPEAVVLPENAEQVAAVLSFCDRHGLPVTTRGAGSGTTGGSVPLAGGVVLSMQRMNRILEIDEENFLAVVEPGVVTADLHKAVEAKGLFYPPDPASMAFSTIGGNIAENAGGMRAVKYGCTAAYVMGLEVVLADGRITHSGSKCIKDVVGFATAPLFIGSEGMLGVITRAWMRLLPLPAVKKTARIAFADLNTAARAVTAVLRSGVIPSTLEFMDKVTLNTVEAHLNMGLPVQAGGMLLIEVDGSERVVAEDMQRVIDVCAALNPMESIVAESAEEQALLWKARRSIPASLFRVRPHRYNEDIVVPRSRIPEMVEKIQEIAQRRSLIIVSFGHAGDGNIHVNVLFNEEEEHNAHEAVVEIFHATAALEGRITGEHGVGLSKKPFFHLNVDAATTKLMRDLKVMLDPKNTLNPNKMFPDEDAPDAR